MQLTPWRPFQDMDDAFGRYARLFNTRFPGLLDENLNGDSQWAPTADISESKKEYLIKADLPDVEKSDIHVSVQDGTLTIEGERKHSKEEEDETVHRMESFHGKFFRAFSLPNNVDTSKIKASCKNGVLRVHVPKTKETAPESAKEIPIN